MVARVHAGVKQVLENRHLIAGLHTLEVIGSPKVSPFLGEEVWLVEAEAATDENDPPWWNSRFRLGGGPQVKRLQGKGQGRPGLEEFFSADSSHS